MFCLCLHAAESHHADGCHVLLREKGTLVRCHCRLTREEVARGVDHLNDALREVRRRTRPPEKRG
jgi:hypothetical protein